MRMQLAIPSTSQVNLTAAHAVIKDVKFHFHFMPTIYLLNIRHP